MTQTLVHNMALRNASAYSEAITEFRVQYTSKVVNRVKDFGVKAVHDYDERPGGYSVACHVD